MVGEAGDVESVWRWVTIHLSYSVRASVGGCWWGTDGIRVVVVQKEGKKNLKGRLLWIAFLSCIVAEKTGTSLDPLHVMCERRTSSIESSRAELIVPLRSTVC